MSNFNKLYYGDNYTIMQGMSKNSVDLIYLDPPFNSKRNYNLMYKNMTGKPVPEQVTAFCDTWEMDAQKEAIARNLPVLMREYGLADYYIQFWRFWIQALRNTQPCLLAYLIYMVQRLLLMKNILAPTGSVYLHCDPTASHYIKVMLDAIWGHDNFGNEIVWHYKRWPSGHKHFQRMHDVILRYVKSDKAFFNVQYQPYSQKTIHRKISVDGKTDLEAKRDEERGTKMDDVWDIPYLHSQSQERLGYPTQKPMALLERIIQASCPEGGVVFDPFCGCGTTIYAAEKLGRKWIGCDIAILAVNLIKDRLAGEYKLTEGVNFTIDGIPVSVEEAEELFRKDPFQFQHWIVERVGGFPMQRKTGDKGIDGRVYFEVGENNLKEMVLSVKGGNIRPTDIRDLRGVLEREENAELAGFISIKETTKAMREEAASAGLYEYRGVEYPRIQLLTVQEILEQKKGFYTPTKIGSKIDTGQTVLPLV